ncbi:hypothetical protein P7K49_015269, partial [Saguinus oedipus]
MTGSCSREPQMGAMKGRQLPMETGFQKDCSVLLVGQRPALRSPAMRLAQNRVAQNLVAQNSGHSLTSQSHPKWALESSINHSPGDCDLRTLRLR